MPKASPSPVPPTGPAPIPASAEVLIYDGNGAWTDEVGGIESILSSHGVSYQTATSAQLNSMTSADFSPFTLIIWPGGDGSAMLNSLSGTTRTTIMNAVRQQGMSYLGFCAGAFMAVSPAPSAGAAPAFLSIIQAPELDYYYLENQGISYTMTMESFADGTQRSILWAGGPVTPNISGGVIAKYSTGDPAMTESMEGNGFVIVSGVHPAAPLADIRSLGATSDDYDIAWELIQAALTRSPLPAF
jgi:glutamine amidotransferase-like uncharacterized protein